MASFVGTTNLLNGVIRAEDGDAAEIEVAGATLRLMDGRGNVGNKVLLSLRPEALRLLSSGETAPARCVTLSGTLGEVEYLGPVTRFTVTLTDGTALSLMALMPPTASGAVTVAFDPQRLGALGAPS